MITICAAEMLVEKDRPRVFPATAWSRIEAGRL